MSTYGYVRVSTARQAEAPGESLAEQERRVRAVALFRGDDEPHIIREPGESGSVPLEERPAGRDLFAVLEPGDVVIVSKLDRAFRSASDALRVAERLAGAGVDLIIADMGNDPVTSNGVGKLFFTMLAAMAEFERERIVERTTVGRRRKAARGGYIGGKAPFGFRIVGEGEESRLVEEPSEQKAIERIRALRAAGDSLRKIAAKVQEECGVVISHEGVRGVLASPLNSTVEKT